MRALLLAAGTGTRLRPLTDTVPKALVEIAGRPLLDRWIEMLVAAGVERILINTHYLADVVQSYIAQSRWRDVVDQVYEPTLVGTGGTLLANRAWFGGGPMLVAHVDNATELDVRAFISAHATNAQSVLATMALFHTDTPQSCGVVVMDDQHIIREFYEKVSTPPGNLANAAAFIFEPEIFTFLLSLNKPVIDLSAEVIPLLMGRVLGFEIAGYHRDIGTPESLSQAQTHFAAARDKLFGSR
jgi:mannose-1-phosphate guanylyltransferase